MGNTPNQEAITAEAVQEALDKLAEYKLHQRLREVSGNEAHRILPIIWPVIKEICLIADAAESGMIGTKSHHNFLAKIRRLFTFKTQTSESPTEHQIRKMFRAMHSPNAGTRKLTESRKLGS